MKLIWQTALRNILRAGLKTWVNVAVLAMVFIIIILYDGLLTGWDEKAQKDTIAWEFGQGHLIHALYDKYDPFSIQVGHGVPAGITPEERAHLTPVLVWSASVYPQQTQFPVVLKGIPRDQTVLELPLMGLRKSSSEDGTFPVIMGELMAERIGMQVGDTVRVQWRDKNRTFDAGVLEVVEIFSTDVPTADQGQIYLDIDDLWAMTQLFGHATYWIADEGYTSREFPDWVFKTQEELFEPFNTLIEAKRAGSSVIDSILLLLALLTIFNTQVMAVFRRQREIGTYVALGMTRLQVTVVFTLEGGVYSLLGMIAGMVVATPLFYYLTQVGIPMGSTNSEGLGIPLGDRIIPVFYFGSILMTMAVIFVAAILVGFIPARKIVKMNPVDALKGKG